MNTEIIIMKKTKQKNYIYLTTTTHEIDKYSSVPNKHKPVGWQKSSVYIGQTQRIISPRVSKSSEQAPSPTRTLLPFIRHRRVEWGRRYPDT